MRSLTAAEAKKNLDRLIDETCESHEPITIAGKPDSRVLLSEKDWESVAETLHLQSIPRMSTSIVNGMNTPSEKCFGSPGW